MRRPQRIRLVVTMLGVVAGAGFMLGATALHSAAMEEQDVPAVSQDQATANRASSQPAVTPEGNRGDDWERVPAEGEASPAAPDQVRSPATPGAPEKAQPVAPPQPPAAPAPPEPSPQKPSSATPEAEPTEAPIPAEASSATPAPEPPPALDISAIDAGADVATKPLDGAIKTALTPSMAASLRVTEQARRQLTKGSIDAALRNLAQAVSIDPGNPFAYYFLGRAHLQRQNYKQALTFFERAQLGFNSKPAWLGETLSYEGACDEALANEWAAAKAYQRALAVAPGNFKARIGYGRLSAILAPTPSNDIPASSNAGAPPPSPNPIDAPPPVEPSAPPAQ